MKLKYAPYSFSKIESFTSCKRKFKHTYIDKLYFPISNIALEKGSYIHKCLEDWVKKDNKRPEFNFKLSTQEDIQNYNNIVDNFIDSPLGKKYFQSLKILGTETKFGLKIDENNQLIETNYYNKKAFIRGMIDQMSSSDGKIVVVDWKSGKVPDEPKSDQVMLYALWIMTKDDSVNKVESNFVYIEHNIEKQFIYTRDELPSMRKKFAMKVKSIENETEFPKNITALCDWCSFKQNGICDTSSTLDEFSRFVK